MAFTSERFDKAIVMFDAYNQNDPHLEEWNGESLPKELLYAQRMSERLKRFLPLGPEYMKLAARCQHIGRWEIPRNTYPMDRKGYLQWRNSLKAHHAKIAEEVLTRCGYDTDTIEKVKFLLLKKELLQHHPDTQVLEDVICLVFIEYYLEDFAARHDDDKVVDILRKTLKKMSGKAIEDAGKIAVSEKISALIGRAVTEKP
ncbi:DUF4202 domain-containing protein [Chryseolinea lacunae]|uniref:DUF4202 domain-containing protein n=1 Tax=Chryseolinea lacunae TaxID=2801331 RepID=A0ABS1KNQ0_9BACT|nr:DUF4202 domain-containing protein [Chryseolinea lacunae]MBL0740317.1 DUF4202 domain-containing protein [Chryseolinea lacunae]